MTQTAVRHPTRLILITTLILLAGCSAPTPERLDWKWATSASGDYIAEFPKAPTTADSPVPATGGTSHSTEVSLSNGSYYSLSEIPFDGVTPRPLDVAVDGAIDGCRSAQKVSGGATATVEDLTRSTGEFDGVETRRFSFHLSGVTGPEPTISALLFYRNDTMVFANVVTFQEFEKGEANRFLSSLTVNADTA